MSHLLRSLLVAGAVLALGGRFAWGQFRPPGRYEAPQSTVEWNAESRPSPYYRRDSEDEGGIHPVEHETWPTHAMHDEAVPAESSTTDSFATEYGEPLPGGHSVQPTGYPQAPDTFTFPPEPPLRSQVRQRLWQPAPEGVAACDEVPWIVPQQTSLKSTVLPGNGDDLGLTDLDARLTLAVPAWTGFTVAPGGIATFVDGPLRSDLPANLYSAWIELQYASQLSPRWSMQLAVAPGVYSDFEDLDGDTLRITGRAIAFYGLSLETQFVLGVAYLDREDVVALPVVGVVHQPNENTRLEIVFPRPRFLYRVHRGSDRGEGWAYLGGEFGGGSWQIRRAGGASDIATYGDWRAVLGYEWRFDATRTLLVEGGWVFNRSLEYESGAGDFDPSDTGLIRAGATF